MHIYALAKDIILFGHSSRSVLTTIRFCIRSAVAMENIFFKYCLYHLLMYFLSHHIYIWIHISHKQWIWTLHGTAWSVLSVAWQPLYWLSSTIYNQSCFSSTTVWMQQTGVSKAICTVSSTKSTSTVMIVVLPRLPVLQMPAIFLVDTTQSIGNCELLHTTA